MCKDATMYFSESVCTSTTFSSVTSLHPSSLLGMGVSHAASPMHRVTKKTQNIIDLTERCRCSSNTVQFEQRNVHATQSMNGMAITHVRENCLSLSLRIISSVLWEAPWIWNGFKQNDASAWTIFYGRGKSFFAPVQRMVPHLISWARRAPLSFERQFMAERVFLIARSWSHKQGYRKLDDLPNSVFVARDATDPCSTKVLVILKSLGMHGRALSTVGCTSCLVAIIVFGTVFSCRSRICDLQWSIVKFSWRWKTFRMFQGQCLASYVRCFLFVASRRRERPCNPKKRTSLLKAQTTSKKLNSVHEKVLYQSNSRTIKPASGPFESDTCE